MSVRDKVSLWVQVNGCGDHFIGVRCGEATFSNVYLTLNESMTDFRNRLGERRRRFDTRKGRFELQSCRWSSTFWRSGWKGTISGVTFPTDSLCQLCNMKGARRFQGQWLPVHSFRSNLCSSQCSDVRQTTGKSSKFIETLSGANEPQLSELDKRVAIESLLHSIMSFIITACSASVPKRRLT